MTMPENDQPDNQKPLTILIAAETYPPDVNGAPSSVTAWPRA